MKQYNPIFVVSDLHLGSGGRRDSFSVMRKEKLFFDFLDFVERNSGELIITGDLVDMWRFSFKKTVKRHAELLDRLEEMKVTYIVGNHDQAVETLRENKIILHPLFQKTYAPFTRTIGNRRFKFMHGHEFDPFNCKVRPLLGKALCISVGTLEWLKGAPGLAFDVIEDALRTFEDRLMDLFCWLYKEFKKTFGYDCTENDFAWQGYINNHIRKMLARHQDYKTANGHDILITAHTHKAASFKNWYFNSGSWIRENNNFLCIAPDGGTTIYDWTAFGPRKNQTVLCV